MTSYADRVNHIEPFRVVEVLTRAKALEASGADIILMEVGEPDFAPLDEIANAAKQALDAGQTYYSPASGIIELREAISKWYDEALGLNVPVQRIMITPGASGALLLISALLIEPGRAMLMADPGYPCNRNFLRLFGGEEQLIPVDASDNFQITAAKAEHYWQPNTVGVIAASPSNPTGTIIAPNELQKLHVLCKSRQASLLVDEIYQNLVYEQPVTSALSITDDVFVINSFSKYFGMTGWRLGWLVAPEAAVDAMDVLAQNLFISMSTPAQHAALAGFGKSAQQQLKQRVQAFGQRRDFLLPELKALGFEIETTAQGAFYIYANIRKITALDSQQFCLQLLEQQGVAVTPGADFGYHKAQDYVRFSYTTEVDRLAEGVARIRRFLSG
jgi:aspartate/methionine/tyrosine aminotransferase